VKKPSDSSPAAHDKADEKAPDNPEKPRSQRSRRGYKIRNLPAELHKQLDERLGSGEYGSLRNLAQWLRDNGHDISHSSISKYKRKFEQRLEAVRLASYQARAVVDSAPDNDAKINEGLMRLVQTTLFEMLVEMNDTRQRLAGAEVARAHSRLRLNMRAKRARARGEAQPTAAGDEEAELNAKWPTAADLAAVNSVARTIATLGKFQLDWQKWRSMAAATLSERVNRASEVVAEAARKGGLSGDAEKQIRDALLWVGETIKPGPDTPSPASAPLARSVTGEGARDEQVSRG